MSDHQDDRGAPESPTVPDEELDAMLDELEGAGLIEQYIDADGKAAMRLTTAGEQVARQMALSGEDDAAVLLAALLEGSDK